MPEEYYNLFVEYKIMHYLIKLKIYPNLKGYSYIVQGIKILLDDSTKKKNIIKNIYEVLAKCFNTDAASVDSSLHHAIKICRKNNGLECYKKEIQGLDDGKLPTPREFLSSISFVIKRDLIKESKKFA